MTGAQANWTQRRRAVGAEAPVPANLPIRNVEIWILLALIAVAAGLRAFSLDSGLWFDEIQTLVQSVRRPVVEILTRFEIENDHKLYSLLAHLSIEVFGDSAWSLRLPAAVFGVVSIPLLYLFGRHITSRFEALLATSILTVSYHHLWFSQNARAYTMILCSVLLSTLLVVRAWEGRHYSAHALLYTIVVALGAYAHLTVVVVALTHGAISASRLFFMYRAGRPLGQWQPLAMGFLGSAVLTLVLYAPLLGRLPTMVQSRHIAANAEVATPFWAVLAALDSLQTGFGSIVVVAIGLALFSAGVWSFFHQDPWLPLLLFLPPGVMLALLVATGSPVRPRFVFFSIGFCLLGVVRGTAAIGTRVAATLSGGIDARRAGRTAAATIAAGAIAFSLVSLPYGYSPKQDYEGAVRFVEQNASATDTIAAIALTATMPVLDYMGRPWRRIDGSPAFRGLLTEETSFWALYAFPDYIATDDPELSRLLVANCGILEQFEGTVPGGVINVSRCGTSAR